MRAISRVARHAAGEGLGDRLWREHAGKYRGRDADGVRVHSALSSFELAVYLARGCGRQPRGPASFAPSDFCRMKITRLLFYIVLPLAARAAEGDYVEHYDTLYNSLTVERRGAIVELRARARGS